MSSPLSDQDLLDLERIACDIAVAAGRLVVDERPDDLGVAATKSSVVDVVTVMDQRSEELLRARLAHMRPDDAVLGEEGDTLKGTSGITWVLDPIDGTVNYLYNIPEYAISVAACVGDVSGDEWEVVVGAVYHPSPDLLYHARRGGGAYVRSGIEGEPGEATTLAVSRQTDLGVSLVATGFGYDPAVRSAQGAVLAEVLPHVRDIRRMGACALDLAAVAAGRIDAYYESGPKIWDFAAGSLLVTEAGGALRGPSSGPANPQLIVAGPPALVDSLAPRVDRSAVP